jgi:hypothetical protein
MQYSVLPLNLPSLDITGIFKEKDFRCNDEAMINAWKRVASEPMFEMIEWCDKNMTSKWSHYIQTVRNMEKYREEHFLIFSFESDKDYFAFELKYGGGKEC